MLVKNNAVLIAIAFTLGSQYPSFAADATDPTATANLAYEHVQQLRNDARRGIQTEKPSNDTLQKSEAMLKDALLFLAQPRVLELANGNIYLAARKHDVLMDMAMIYVRLGQHDKALDAIESMERLVVVPQLRKMFESRAELAPLQNEPRFKAYLQRLQNVDALWRAPELATPYKERLTPEERVAGLSLFWAEARAGFVNFDLTPDVSLNKIYMDGLKAVLAAETTRDYYDVLMRLAPLLRDGHTNIYPPKQLQDSHYSRPPLRTELIENRVVITHVYSAELAKRVSVGDEIIAIDAMPVGQYVAEKVAPYVSASTPQDRAMRSHTYQLLSGDAAKPIALTLRNEKGKERAESIARSGYSDTQYPPKFSFQVSADGVATIALDHFESDEGVKAFVKALPEILKAKALIIDVRRNGGGSGSYGLQVLSYLTREPVPTAISRIRSETALDRSRSGGIIYWKPLGDNKPYTAKREAVFTGPVAVLSSAQSFSAAEDFLVSFQLLKRGLIVGQTSGGSTGQPLTFDLPGGGKARICVKRDSYPDGSDFVGRGVLPTILVEPTIAHLRSGTDTVWERAKAAVLTQVK
jgi:carboxyl-terminal processing protease